MNPLRSFIALLQKCLARLTRKTVAEHPPVVEPARVHGTTGLVNAPTLWLHEDPHIVLLVDYDFQDFPSWVEWDRKARKLFVVQMGGDAAELALDVPANQNMPTGDVHRLMLVTGRQDRRNAHFVSFIIRD